MTAGDLESLEAIGERIGDLAARIGAPPGELPTLGRTEDFARPHIEVDSRYHWVVVERGQELERRSTGSLDQLLYWTFNSVTFAMASAYELANRRSGVDFRRLLFARQLELLAILDPDWSRTCAADLDRTLARHPFVDALDEGRRPVLDRLFGWMRRSRP